MNNFIKETFEQYQLQPQLNWSKIKYILKSPKNYKLQIEPIEDEDEKATDAKIFGILVHSLILDKEMKSVIIYSHDKKEQNILKASLREKYEVKYTGLPQFKSFLIKKEIILIDEKGLNNAKWIAEKVSENKRAKEIIEECDKETSAYTENFKGRFDLMQKDKGYLADIKTAEDVSINKFTKAVSNLGYHNQAAFYLTLANKIVGCEFFTRFYWIALEKTGIHCVVYDASEWLDEGFKQVTKALNLLEFCQKNDVWDGYQEEQILPLSKWLKPTTESEE